MTGLKQNNDFLRGKQLEMVDQIKKTDSALSRLTTQITDQVAQFQA